MIAAGEIGGCEPILCAHLLRKVDGALIQLLESLRPEEWNEQTIAPRWKVCDVAAHLLDTALRKLSLVRDGWWVQDLIAPSTESIVDLVNRLNREGVAVYRRLSPAVLVGMMRLACEESAGFHESLDPFAVATFNVSWAGEETSLNWFDTARELTERWHHQQQIRLATERPGIMTRELYYPVLDCFLRGLPYAYRGQEAEHGTSVVIHISGECGGRWVLRRGSEAWDLVCETPKNPECTVTIPQEIAWRVFTKGIDRDEARERSSVQGDAGMAEGIFRLTAIVG